MHIYQILYGNLAPEGSVAKITGKEGLRFEGTAKVYDSEELMMEGLNKKEITKGSFEPRYVLHNLHLQYYKNTSL
jgi:dihydroxyacid dehydratase/phosphogluconate dehydratase